MDDPLKKDFRNFLFLVWKHIGLPKPTRVQYDIAHFLQTGPRRKMVQAFRGVGKTWVTAAYIVWRLYLDPDIKILVVSASKAHADNTTTFCLQIINTVPELRHLAPREDQRNSKIQFDVGPARGSRDPSVKSVGITGQITGSRADLIIPDDVETPSNVQTQMMREKLKQAVEEFGAVLKPDGEVVYLGTPQCEDSLYRSLPAKGYTVRTWPARYPNERQLVGYGDQLSPTLVQDLVNDPKLVGRPADPERFSDVDLLEREAEYARSGFALQFMLDTSLSDQTKYPLKLSDLIVMNLNPDQGPEKVVWAASPDLIDNELPNVGLNSDRFYRPMQIQGLWVPYQGSVMAIDPSGRGKDETGVAVIKMLNGQLFVTELVGLIGGYSPETLEQIARIAKREKVNFIRVESNFGDGMFEELLKPVLGRIYPCTVEGERSTGQKEKRIIDTLEPVLNSHKLVVDRKVIEADSRSTQGYPSEHAHSYQAFHQLTRITKDRGSLRHDDRLDSLAIAVGYWVEQMARDVDKQMVKSNHARLEQSLRDFNQHVLGYKPSDCATWMKPR